jgi:tRNA-dihydrouridine synthase A
MMDWTDRHCRYFHRQLSSRSRLYTEMVTTGALIHGNQPRHLDFDPREQPVALQVGGSDPSELAVAAKLAAKWGYSEINLNCGCPSERVQRGSFGACLMAEPALVAQCIASMRNACDLPVTVKHRIGLDANESFDFVADFVGTVSQAGCDVFIVHARNAWLKGLSPKQNREVPPLRYDVLVKLKHHFADLSFIANGGVNSYEAVQAQLDAGLDGVMVGRHAYQEPYWLAQVDQRFFGVRQPSLTRAQVTELMIEYARAAQIAGVPVRGVARHMLGLFNGMPRARLWRQRLSEPRFMDADPIAGMQRALETALGTGMATEMVDKFDQSFAAD